MDLTEIRRPLERRARRSGTHASEKHLRPMPRWLALGAASALTVAGSIALAQGRRADVALRWGLSGAAAAVAGLLMGSIEVRQPVFERLCLPIDHLPPAFEGLSIGIIGDFHLEPGYRVANIRRARSWLEQSRPDVILLTGDFVDHRRNLPLLAEELRGLQAPLGVYGVLGNHDYWFEPADTVALIEDLGYTMLVNEHRVLEREDQTLVLAGVDDAWYGDSDLEATLRGAPSDAPVILLSHVPDFIAQSSLAGVALQISGHSHAGHLSMPLLGPALLPWGAWEYYRGLQRVGPSWLYINRGLGGHPLRLNAAPEVTLLRLTAA